MTTLIEFTAKYVGSKPLSEGYARILKIRAAALQNFSGLSDISGIFREDTVNSFLATLTELSPFTRNKYRADFLALWRAAADEDLLAYPRARRIRREKPPATLVECYTIDEVRQIVTAAERLKGGYPDGVAKRHYWAGIVRFAWDTGLRRGDCWRFDCNMVKPDGTFRIVQGKTRKAIRRVLRAETIKAIAKIGRSKPFEFSLSLWCFGVHFKQLQEAAGVNRGMFRWLRRAAGSHVEAEHPGAGHKVLGNTPQVFRQHYDADLASEVFAPPAL
jgi:integrase